MRSIKKQDEDDVEVVSGASNRVAEDGSELQAAQGDEAASRKRVVDHELQVARQRLADAQAEEEAAAKAKAEADEAEEEAKEKHEVAAQDMKDAAEGRLAARRAREIAWGAADAVDGVEKYAEKSAAAEEAKAQDEGFERTCTDVISVLGCGRLPKGSTCARFCGKGASNQGSADAKVRQGGSSSKSKSKSSSSERKEKKSGGSYVDSVYGKGYDPSTYTHDRKGFFTREPQARRDDQQAADEGALARMAYSRGGDVESNGLDSGEVWANSRLSEDGGGKLAKERAKENQLERELIREKAENEVLRGRVSGRGVEWPGDHSHPPLPQYSATEGTQQLASVYKQSAKQAWGGRAGEQANKEEEQVHRRSAKTSDGSLFDPFRP
jgi:colicin import membrane protein